MSLSSRAATQRLGPSNAKSPACVHLSVVTMSNSRLRHHNRQSLTQRCSVKLISADFVLWQILVTRSIIAIPLLIAIILLRFGSTSLAPLGWVALRA